MLDLNGMIKMDKTYNYKKLIPSLNWFKKRPIDVEWDVQLNKTNRSKLSYKLVFLNPGTWLRNQRTCKIWDKELNEMLDNPVFTEGYDGSYLTKKSFDDYTITLNGTRLWISNYPYCYGYNYDNNNSKLPKRGTVKRLHNILKQEERKFYA